MNPWKNKSTFERSSTSIFWTNSLDKFDLGIKTIIESVLKQKK